jgi:hypothetical protein
MVTPATTFTPETSVDLDQTALEAAAEVWAMLETAALLPASAETRAELAVARRGFRTQLEQLEITEQMLCHHLRAKLAPAEASEGRPPLAPS